MNPEQVAYLRHKASTGKMIDGLTVWKLLDALEAAEVFTAEAEELVEDLNSRDPRWLAWLALRDALGAVGK